MRGTASVKISPNFVKMVGLVGGVVNPFLLGGV